MGVAKPKTQQSQKTIPNPGPTSMVAIWINKGNYIRFEGLKLKMNFVKNFGPGPTSIVMELQKIKKNWSRKRLKPGPTSMVAIWDEIKRDVVTVEKIRRERMNR